LDGKGIRTARVLRASPGPRRQPRRYRGTRLGRALRSALKRRGCVRPAAAAQVGPARIGVLDPHPPRGGVSAGRGRGPRERVRKVKTFSLRARLTVWYTVALAVVLALFSVQLLWVQERLGVRRVDRDLDEIATTVANIVRSELQEHNTPLVAA